MAEPPPRKRVSWRPFVRSLHRDLGYTAIGLTFVYALSGLAVNHIADWDPNFQSTKTTHFLKAPLPENDPAVAAAVTAQLGIRDPARVVFSAPGWVDLEAGWRKIHVDSRTGKVTLQGQRPRPFLRLANWLHLNRGKKAWTLVADFYAVGLLTLAVTGLFMLPGKNGIFGRGGVFVVLGIAIPLLYVVLSGGPGHK
jgi:uncharacterized protein